MTAEEKKRFDALEALVKELTESNKILTQKMLVALEAINQKVEKKHLPISLEQSILSTTQSAIDKSIQTALSAYDSPLTKLIKSVVDEHSKELKDLVSTSFGEVIRTDDFRKSIVQAFSHKVAKTIISNNDGLFDKVSNELKADAVFKAKMVAAVARVVEDCMTNKA